jgi:sec-independent protein translocase protein TatA
MGALQPLHLILVLAIVMLLFGSTKLPELGRGLGEAMKELRKATKEEDETAPTQAKSTTTAPTTQNPSGKRDVV